MDYPLYELSLSAALALLLFFALYFIFGRVPDKPIFRNYLRSRRVIGSALLLLAINYTIHLTLNLRFTNTDIAICMNLSTYYFCSWLFGSALTSLLEKGYLTKEHFVRHVIGWLLFTAASAIVILTFPKGLPKLLGVCALAAWFFVYYYTLARHLVRTYRRVVRVVDDYCSEDVSAYIQWMSIITYWAVVYGVSCGLLTFLPEQYVFLWVLSSIPFYIYLYCSYMNYLLFYEQVESVLETQMTAEADHEINMEADSSETPGSMPASYSAIAVNLSAWIEHNSFTRPGFTIEDLAVELGTNRTYLSGYIRTVYKVSFRDLITGLRLEYAKKMLIAHPELTVSGVSESSGFLSLSYFTKIFTEKEGCSPARWRKSQLGDKS